MTRLLRSDESGFSLIEVLVSALLVATVSVGTFKGIDTASHTSGDQRQRATAATLAQQEIERLRSMNPTTLSGYVTTPRPDSTDNRNGVDYTTSTAVNWRNDVNEGTACTGAANGTRYLALKITTTYTFNTTTHTVTKTGQAAVPVTGNRLIVQVYKAGKLANPNVPVELRNASNVLVDTVNTSSAGCVEWDFLSAGSYTVTANKAGLVTPSGAATASQTVSMATTGANTVALDYDQAGTVTVNWYTQYDRTVPVWCPSGPVCPKRYAIAGTGMDRMTASNSSMGTPRVFGTAGTLAPTLTTSGDGAPPSAGLFPFTSAYTIFPGVCQPAGAGVGAGSATPTVTAGGTPSVDIRMNQFDLNVQYRTAKSGAGSTYVNATGARLTYIRAAGDGCPSVRLPDQLANSAGDAPWNGVPSGMYDICAEVQIAGSYYFANPGGSLDIRDFTSPSSSYQLLIQAYGSGSPGRCPL